MKKMTLKILPALVIASFLFTGCNQPSTTGTTKAVKPAAQVKKQQNVKIKRANLPALALLQKILRKAILIKSKLITSCF